MCPLKYTKMSMFMSKTNLSGEALEVKERQQQQDVGEPKTDH